MKIHNIRLGFANNSSSSHSLIFLPSAKDNLKGTDKYQYGWENFVLASAREKVKYLATLLYQNLREEVSNEVANAVVSEWLGVPEIGNADSYIGVDHQSVLTFPRERSDKFGIDRAFFGEFVAYVLQGSLVILGGNDNDDVKHKLKKTREDFVLPLPREDPSTTYARKDAQGFWSIFNTRTGAKIRFSFKDKAEMFTPQYSSAPELVDLKVTNFCPYNCSFCYQSSTVAGRHATMESIWHLGFNLRKMEVFEVAIGGGEPTLHPDFLQILKFFRRETIVPNFTTRNLAWLHDHNLAREILDTCGSFAFSVEEAEQVDNLAKLLSNYGTEYAEKATVQVVLGVVDPYRFNRIVRRVKHHQLRLTLLGYKAVGFGENYKPKPYPDWVRELEQERVFQVSIDTALAGECAEQLKALGVPEAMYHVTEGGFSCYVDLVRGTMAPSSYTGVPIALPNTVEEFLGVYRSFAPKEPEEEKA